MGHRPPPRPERPDPGVPMHGSQVPPRWWVIAVAASLALLLTVLVRACADG